MILLFYLTVLIGSALIFTLEPLIGKVMLPTLGGASSVWNTCLLYFQIALLLGYLYAHVFITRLKTRRAYIIHTLLIIIGVVVIKAKLLAPFQIPLEDPKLIVSNLLLWLLSTTGLAFILISTTAPLAQAWFSRTKHSRASDPYFLYAASNIGSLGALIAYPTIIEPTFDVSTQLNLWAYACMFFCLLLLACGFLAYRANGATSAENETMAETSPAPNLKLKLRWLACSMLPSSLLLATTTHITTNVAAVPLLWVLPLSIYLITFIAAFSPRFSNSSYFVDRFLPLVILPLLPALMFDYGRDMWLVMLPHICILFFLSYFCHLQLASRRPGTKYLTHFYLYISIGGALGGVFNVLVAPMIFNQVYEYPLVFLLVMFLRQTNYQTTQGKSLLQDILWPGVIVAYYVIIFFVFEASGSLNSSLRMILYFGIPAIVGFAFRKRSVRFALACVVILLALSHTKKSAREKIYTSRNFFGVKRVEHDPKTNERLIIHGHIVHGAQSQEPGQELSLRTYYHPQGPVGDIFSGPSKETINSKVAVVGLGAGAIACYAKPDQEFIFYELDIEMLNIANQQFTYLAKCPGKFSTIIGDGRLNLAKAVDSEYDLIFIDVFTADAIPVHLITLEALQMALSKLSEHGLIIYNVSNSYLNFEPLIADMALKTDLSAVIRYDLPKEKPANRTPSIWAVFSRHQQDVDYLLKKPGWHKTQALPGIQAWTDRYSNIVSLMLAKELADSTSTNR